MYGLNYKGGGFPDIEVDYKGNKTKIPNKYRSVFVFIERQLSYVDYISNFSRGKRSEGIAFQSLLAMDFTQVNDLLIDFDNENSSIKDCGDNGETLKLIENTIHPDTEIIKK